MADVPNCPRCGGARIEIGKEHKGIVHEDPFAYARCSGQGVWKVEASPLTDETKLCSFCHHRTDDHGPRGCRNTPCPCRLTAIEEKF